VINTVEITPMVVIYSISMVQDITDPTSVKIGELNQQSIAYKGGLRTGDIIQAIKYSGENNVYVLVSTWKQVYDIFTENVEGNPMTLKVLRGEEVVECEVKPYSKELFDKTQNVGITAMLLGVSPKTKFNLGKSITTRNSDRFNFVTEPKDYNDLIEKLNKMTISITVGYKNGDVKTYDVPIVIEDLKI
jgi:hypothetical protein